MVECHPNHWADIVQFIFHTSYYVNFDEIKNLLYKQLKDKQTRINSEAEVGKLSSGLKSLGSHSFSLNKWFSNFIG